MEAIVKTFAASPAGSQALLAALETGVLNNSGLMGHDAETARRMEAAFDGAVRNGAWTEANTKALVAAEVAGGHVMRSVIAVSEYTAGLSGPHADETLAAIAKESLAAAKRFETPAPGARADAESSQLLYAQATQALGKMQPVALQRTLAELRAADPNAIARLSYGAMGGTQALSNLQSSYFEQLAGHIQTDGVGSMIRTLATSGARSEMVDAVRGVSTYLTEKHGTAAEQLLLDHDAQTGLRGALAAASHFEPGGKANFDALLAANREASGLNGDGMNLIANLSRVELGASAHDEHARQFGESMGNALGHLAVDLARGNAAQADALQSDFGAHAFGRGTPGEQELAGARTLGNLVHQLREGLNQDFNGRAATAAARQEQLTGTLESLSSVITTAAKIPGEQSEALKTLGETLDAVKGEIPRDRTLTSEESHKLVEQLQRGFESVLNGNRGLQAEYRSGLSDSGTWGRDGGNDDGRDATNEASGTSGGLLGRAIRDVVAPQRAEPAPERPPSPAEMTEAIRNAVREYNYDPAHRATLLREPSGNADVRPWNDGARPPAAVDGTLLKVKIGETTEYVFAVHGGRGTYLTLDPVNDLHGVEPSARDAGGHERSLVGSQVRIQSSGVVEPSGPALAPAHTAR